MWHWGFSPEETEQRVCGVDSVYSVDMLRDLSESVFNCAVGTGVKYFKYESYMVC